MKNIYFKSKIPFLALLVLLLGSAMTADAQIKKSFTQRTSQYTPTKKIYNVKGDFTMLGNTCLTPQDYADNINNNGQFMTYVDKDTDPNTVNSSSSTLSLSTENGAVPACSNIIYAGLYWTGKSSANETFTVPVQTQTGTQTLNNNYTVGHNDDVTNTNYSLSIGRNNPSNNNRNPIYTFSGNGNTYVFNFFNASAPNRVTLSVNSGAAVNVPVSVNGSGTEATLTTPYSITDGTLTIKINKLIRNNNTNLSLSDTQDTSSATVNVSGLLPIFTTVNKPLDKKKILLKGPTAGSYTQFTAAAGDIYYPSGSDDDIFSAYTEITDYVRNHGVGEYWAADMALLEGNAGGTGYSGGWGIIVVYENSKMKYRDVTIFDGYAYVESANSSGFTLPVTGFNTVQTGNVGLKLGVMASEGDVAFTGDYFRVQKLASANYQTLTHSNTPGGNDVPETATNFFTSAINSGGARNPNLLNNTGIDVNMINVPNTGNTVIGNSQTSTNFKYGTDGDTYSIFAIAMAVDAYIPDVEGSIAALTVNGVPATNPVQAVLPGQNLVYKVEIRNRGTEPINNFKVTIPIPYNATYVPTATKNVYFTPAPSPNTLTFEPTIGSNGSIVWNLGTLPLPANGNPDTLLGDLTFTLKATEDCTLLKNANCNNVVATNGIITGTGAITGIVVTDKSLIQGYTTNGSCTGVAISAPFLVNINAVDYVNTHCQGTPPITAFVFCSPGNNIPITSVSGSFPAGSLFYNQFPVTGATTQYTINNPFPATVGTSTYYAVPPNSVSGCYFQFTITVTTITSQPTTTDISYCQNAQAAPLTATASAPGMTLYYYTSVNGTAQVSITPSTATIGQTTYYVAEGQSTTCIGPKKPIVVTVYPAPTITAPANATVQGCSTASITGLPYSTTAATITLAQLITAGGTLPNSGTIGTFTLSYIDAATGTCPIIITRTYTVATICGNVTAQQTITISDTVAPVISSLPAASTVSCTSGALSFATPTATDNCGGVVTLTSADVTTPGACINAYSVTRTWTATDPCGNVSHASQTINVNDNVPPVISALPASLSMACSSTPQWTTPTATDTCGGTVTLTSVDATTPGACANTYTLTRTWTATDACGNTATASQVIDVIDNVPPVISALPTVSTIQCTATPQWTTPTATDTCGGTVTLTQNTVTTPGACANAYILTRTWTATDACGNTATASQVINVIDNVPPTISALPTVSTIQCTATPQWTTPTATDTCAGTVTLTSVDVTTPGACANTYTLTRTWTATDACGNTATASQVINVIDTVPPTISALPAASTVQCTATLQWTTPTATDTCSGTVTLTSVDVTTPGACANAYSVTRTWTATDACGNTATATQTITVQDNTPPVISQLPAASTISCPATPQWTTPTATDTCSGNVTLTSVDVTTPGACANANTITRTWTATDACGNTATATQVINVIDNTPPVISQLPAASTISCPATPQWTTPTATDTCSGNVTLTSVDVTTPGSCANAYSVTRTWTATDACGNTATATQTITVQDNTPPVISVLPVASTISCPATPQWATPTATDTCSGTVTLTSVDVTTPGACAGSYSVTRTWTATDACGNTATATQVINVTDTVAPVISQLPAASTISCPAQPEFAVATATDACGSSFTLTSADVTTPGACANSYSVTRTWIATDACGNVSTASQTIIVQDNTPPVISQLPTASTISCPATPQWTTPTATDTCSGNVTLTSVDATTPGACAGSYSVTRTWTATDACGNTATASQVINVTDTTAPVIAPLPVASTINCPAQPEFAVATAIDACGSTFTLTSADVTTPGSCAGNYSVTRTWTATDACGNASTATQTINVQDITAPTITAEAQNITVQCDGTGNTGAVTAWLNIHGGATATDACSTVAWTNNFNALSSDCSAAVTVIFTATDGCGNASATSATFTVQDTTAPVAPQAPAAVNVVCASDVPANISLTATDNCAGEITVQGVDVVTPGNCANSFVVTRTWTFTDACGNSSNVSQAINVNDTVAPVAPEAPANVTASCAGDVPAMISLTATDNCNGAITVEGVDTTVPGSCANSFVTTRTWTFVDACGNSSSTSQTITINDTIAPIAPQAPANVTASCGGDVPAMISLTATDNCNGAITVQGVDTTVPGSCPNSFVTTRTWTFVDACGNTSSVSQTITINDTIAPVIAELPAVSTINCPAAPAFAVATATDNCAGDVTLTSVDATTEGTCAGSYSVTRTWTATDACGNTATATQTINVQDNTAPVISQLPAASTINCPAQPVFAEANAVDACGSAFTLTSADVTTPGSCAGNYSVTRTWTATDACGNIATSSQTINVQDITAPTITAEAQNLTVQCDGSGNTGAITAWLDNHAGAIATDACSDVTWTNNFNALSSDCSAAVTVIFTATDGCGNASTTSATFTVQDTTAPVAPEAPAAANVVCASDVPANISLTATDNCAGTITVQGVDTTVQGACPNSFVTTRTWTFTDACGNSSNVSQTINVNDTVAPVAPEAPANVTVSCVSEIPAMISLTATDNCGDQITSAGSDLNQVVVGACANNFTVIRTWSFTDACGNSSSVSQTIIVNDTTAPVAPEAPANVTASCAGDVPAMISLTATDNCGEQITAEGVDTTVAGDCPNSFVTTRTWTFTDVCGNTSSVTQTITINDTTAPVAPEAPAALTVSCAGEVPAMISLTASDNCGEQITAEGVDTTIAGACPNSFVTTRTWTFTDACGNTSSATQTITVNDTTAPVPPTAPADVTGTCTVDVPAMISLTATDNCGDQITVQGVDTTVAGACANSFVTTRTWTFVDACGNTSSTTQTISVTDTVLPTFVETAPADISVSCDAIPAAATLTAVDNCDNASVPVTMTETTVAGDCPNASEITRTWSATDACGNTATTSQVITVMDVTPPTFDAPIPANISVSCDAVPTAATITASDNCGTASVTYTETRADGLCLSSYVLTRTWIATDLCGNQAVPAVQVINVSDTTGPTIDGTLQNVVVGTCDNIPVAPQLTFIDNCSTVGTPVFTEVIDNPTGSTTYDIIRTWTVADACGNESVFTQTVNVTPNPAFTVTVQGYAICNDATQATAIDLNTLLPQGTPAGGTWTDLSATGGLTGSSFNPSNIVVGFYDLQYVVADGNCSRTVNVHMEVDDDCGIVEACASILVHNAFSPNNDGLNEWFQIDNLELFDCYPKNSVEIYNRWGVLVYETKQYDNAVKSFKGISEGRTTVDKASELPTGTYFYILQYDTTEGKTVKKDGYLYLSR